MKETASLYPIEGSYPLELLDHLVCVALLPDTVRHSLMEDRDALGLISRIESENSKLQKRIRSDVFNLTSEQECSVLVRRYHSLLVALLEQSADQRDELSGYDNAIRVYDSIIACIEQLLAFIQSWFWNYLDLEDRMPKIYLSIVREEGKVKFEEINKKTYEDKYSAEVFQIIVEHLREFLFCEDLPYPITYRMAFYMKGLLAKLCEDQETIAGDRFYPAIDELLIYLNFNNKAYIRRFTAELARKLKDTTNISERLDLLLIYQKAFHQLHPKPGTALNPGYYDLQQVIEKWFAEEIGYLERRLTLPVPNSEAVGPKKANVKPEVVQQKVTCMLSSDVISLIIRAADEARVVMASSMNEVFKTVIPHLSTPRKEDLSYKAVRTKSYSPEDKDKDLAIETLEKMIKKIKDY